MSSPPPIPACDPEAQGYYYPLTPMSEGESLHSFESPGTQWSHPLTPTSDGIFHLPYAYDAPVDSMTLHGSARVGSANSPLTASSDGHLDLLSHQSWSDFVTDTQTNADSPFLTSSMPDSSQLDTDIWFPGFDIDSNVLGDLDTLPCNQMQYPRPGVHHGTACPPSIPQVQQLSLYESGALRLERSFASVDATSSQEYIFTPNSPQSALLSFVDSDPSIPVAVDAGLHFGLAEIFAPSALRADPARGSLPTWLDSEGTADESLYRALLRNRILRGCPDGIMSLEQRGVSTPDTPALTESSSPFVSTPHTPGSSASSLMSPSPNPSSLQDEGPDATNLRRVVVGSTANVNAARLRRKRPAKFQCGQCGRTFTARHNLKNHENAHNGIHPFPCGKQCGQKFTTASTAARHTKTCKASAR